MPIKVVYQDNTEKKFKDFEEIENYDIVKILYCSYMKLKELPILPQNLERLDCYNNQIKSLNNLPKKLKILNCSENKLTSLENLPQYLIRLYCNYNQIKYIDNSLLQCRNLQYINYSNNPLTIQQKNFITWIQERNRQRINNNYYKDGQNVHNSSIQKSIRRSIENLMNFQ